MIDPYLDENTGALRNLLGAQTVDELAHREAQVVFANEMSLSADSVPPTRDMREILLIHKKLFAGVYDWAGQVRTVDIKKNEAGAEFFLPVSKITTAFQYVTDELKRDSYLRSRDQQQFVEGLAAYYDKLNYIHPFREGNGRVQRIFWSRVAADAGYSIDWSRVVGNENNEASRLAAETLDLSALKAMFERIVSAIL